MRLILLAILFCGCVYIEPRPEDLLYTADLAAWAPNVPAPGAGPLAADWLDFEPNDTPETAAPIGTATANDVLGGDTIVTWMGFNMQGAQSGIGGADTADYYVFGSGVATKFQCQICWNVAGNLLDFTLYKVVDGQPLVEVASSVEQNTSCENIVPKILPLEPMQKYLLAVRSIEGAANYSS